MATINGTSIEDVLLGTTGADTINGQGAADHIQGDNGIDSLNGGDGDDFIYGRLISDQTLSDGGNFMDGGAGRDFLRGANDADTILGGDGDDSIEGWGGADILDGGNGTDSVLFLANGTSGVNFTFDTSAGDHTSYVGDTYRNFERANINTSTGNDILTGGGGDDIINSSTGTDVVNGAGGTDFLAVTRTISVAGVSFVFDTAADTDFTTGDGLTYRNFEVLLFVGGSGDDNVTGAGGADSLMGGSGNDTLDGAGGIDTASYGTALSGVTVSLALQGGAQATGGAGTDTLSNFENLGGSGFGDTLTGDGGNNVIQGSGGSDVLNGGDGNDILDPGLGVDVANGGDGIDTIALASVGASPSLFSVFMEIDLEAQTYRVDGSNSGTFTGIENALLPRAGDIYGTTGANLLTGGAMTNTLIGRGGADTLNGGAGDDFLADSGSETTTIGLITLVDVVTTGGGGAAINGGDGFDYAHLGLADRATPLVFALGAANTTSTLTINGVSGTTVTGVEAVAIFGGSAGDVFTGNTGADVLNGGGGGDSLTGGGGDDDLDGGAGADTALFQASRSSYSIVGVVGGFEVQDLRGGAPDGVDRLAAVETAQFADQAVQLGTSGDDSMSGDAGANNLAGGLGNDTYTANHVGDVVIEASGQGTDTVVASASGFTLAANVENLVNSSAGLFVGYGNAQANGYTGGGGADVAVLFGGGDTAILGAGNDYVYAGEGDDSASGDAGIDVLLGELGDDTLNGGADQDYLFGDAGNDTLNGDGFVDVLLGGAGNDMMNGGDGGDYFYGEDGADTGNGEAGNDIFVMAAGNDTGNGGDGQDYFYMGDGDDVMNGGAGVDVMLGEGGGDTFNGGLDVDYAFLGPTGANDNDTVILDKTNSGVIVVNAFEAGGSNDVVRLINTGWTSFAQVQANISDFTASGGFCILTLDSDTALWFIGVAPSQLTAGDFTFA